MNALGHSPGLSRTQKSHIDTAKYTSAPYTFIEIKETIAKPNANLMPISSVSRQACWVSLVSWVYTRVC